MFEYWPGAHVAASLIEMGAADEEEVFVPSVMLIGRSMPDAAHIVRVMAVDDQSVAVWKHSKDPNMIDVVCSAMFSLGSSGPKFMPRRRCGEEWRKAGCGGKGVCECEETSS